MKIKLRLKNVIFIILYSAESKRYYRNDLKLVLNGNILSNQCMKIKLRLLFFFFIILYSAESKVLPK